MLREAIVSTFQVEASSRAMFLDGRLREIEDFIKRTGFERPWTYTIFTGTDGSTIFRGGTGHSLVVDRDGVLWRARSLEDFETEYDLANNECRIAALTPIYATMFRYGEDGVARS